MASPPFPSPENSTSNDHDYVLIMFPFLFCHGVWKRSIMRKNGDYLLLSMGVIVHGLWDGTLPAKWHGTERRDG